jgi:hypothetical protein
MASHNHGFTNGTPLAQDFASANIDFGGPNSVTNTGIAFTGGGTPANTMQPTTFMNVMVKL